MSHRAESDGAKWAGSQPPSRFRSLAIHAQVVSLPCRCWPLPTTTGTNHGNAELTHARHQAAAASISPAQPLRAPATAATATAARQPRWPIRSRRRPAVHLCYPYKKTEHCLRPMQVRASHSPVALRFVVADLCSHCHPQRSRKVRCNRIPGSDKVLFFLIRPHSSSFRNRYPLPALA